jgi:DNA-binding transcriptional ArsR family regulator
MQIAELARARVLLHPKRVEILDLLRERGTCTELARQLGTSAQNANGHVKELLRAGFVRVVETRQKRNMTETVYEACSKAYWLSPRLTRRMGDDGNELRDRMSLHNLIAMSERLQEDAAALLGRVDEHEVPSIGVTAEITLRTPAERDAFSRDFLRAMHRLLEKYQGAGPNAHSYTAMLVCYPSVEKERRR